MERGKRVERGKRGKGRWEEEQDRETEGVTIRLMIKDSR